MIYFLLISENAFLSASENKDKHGNKLKSLNLRPGAIPTLFLGDEESSIQDIPASLPEVDDSMEISDEILIESSAPVQIGRSVSMASLDNEPSTDTMESFNPVLDHGYAISTMAEASSSVVIDLQRFLELKNRVKSLEKEKMEHLALITSLKKKNTVLKEKCSNFEKFEKLFTPEQIKMICGKIVSPREWSDTAIQQGIEVRYFCRTKGYDFLRKIGFPFPCVTSLISRLALLDYSPGVLAPNFKLLSIMLDNMGDDPGIREGTLAYDAIKINSALTYNPGIQQIEGYATLPPTFDADFKKKHVATHSMVFFLARIKRRWKIPVAYFYTHQDSFTPDSVIKEIESIVGKAKDEASCYTRGFSNDQGSCNQGVWRELGIKLARDPKNPLNIKNSFQMHGMKIYVFADPEHVIKNWRNALFNQFMKDFLFKISEETFTKYAESHHLVSRSVNFAHFQLLHKFQQTREYKYAPRLTDSCFDLKNNYSKMCVPTAVNLMSQQVAAALRMLVAHHEYSPELLTTALYCEMWGKWIHIMTSRSESTSLSYKNMDEFNGWMLFFEEFVTFIGKKYVF